ncbi:Ig-like domain repeat protein [Domibacillus sp. DTU_2020_1001157_1_SI_ALB_TIR_016]|uniref:OmpL47-type beta-barrel domain-containing protein n=1 Tax=Domibacillus sp. DTU_2020_1001157_1_SI_ALB_TIR_016 TaxID=3077789 RepID=UPI0028EF2B18|nr:Ig-like domain repeat protein [Domibacillus sp. DTU_2020_1001157_1_SI_ALB_TIR_016]WNS81304.1 Ig-like domain repeat protein [Domibacillus sp. DTU_2020_1001157_1_SI_ALB_TIR_016]
MKKSISQKLSILSVVLLLMQLVSPFFNAQAETNSSILPPSNLTAQMVTPDDVKLSWSAVYGATGYNVYEIKEGQLTLLGKTTTTSYNLNNMAEGSYRYVVSTLSAEGESGPCAPVTVDVVYPKMGAPDTVTYTVRNGNDLVINWTAAANAEKYNLYELSPTGEKKLLYTGTARTFTLTRVEEGIHQYAVTSMHTLYGESALSEPLKVELLYPVLTPPADFSYTVANGNDITLKWTAAPYATSYKLYQMVDGQPVLKNTVTGTTAAISNTAAGTYEYELRTNSDRFGESAEGSKLTVTVGSITMSAPPNFSYKLQNTNDLTLTWGSVPYANSYKVYQLVDGKKVLKSTVQGTSVAYAKLPGGNYTYEVYSVSDRFGESAEGSRVSLTVEGVTIEAPANVAHKIQNGNDISLSWNTAANATAYKVYQIVDGQKVLKSTVTGTTVNYTNMPAGDYVYEIYSYSDRFGESAEGGKAAFTLEQLVMAAPANFASDVQNGNDIVLSWEAVPYAANYKVYQINDSGQKTLKSTVTAAAVTYANQPEGEYKYEVHSYSSRFGESAEGSTLSLSLVHPELKAPANVKETIKSDTSFSLSWDAAEYATGYKVYQIVDGKKTLKSTVTSPAVTYNSMPSGEYAYVIHAYSSRFGESAEGSQVTFTLTGQTMKAPTNAAYTVVNGNDIKLSWTAAEYATGYKIYQVVDGVKVLKNTVTGSSYTYTNMSAGDYKYVVHSVSTLFGESADGAEISFTLNHPVIEAPGNFTYKIQNVNDVVLSWDAADYANSYKIYEVVNGEKVLKYTGTALTFTLKNVSAGEHTYAVDTVSTRFGESAKSSTVTVTMNEYSLQAPENATYSAANVNDVTLKWNAVLNANGYNIYQIVDGKAVLKKTVTGTSVSFASMPEGDYLYEIRAYSDRFGESPEGSHISFKIIYPEIEAPEALSYKIQNGNDVVLSWNATDYANSYKVYEVIDGQKVLKATRTTLNATFTNVPAGEHTYVVHSVSTRFGESTKGSSLTFVMNEYNLQAPENLAYSAANVSDITLKWDPVPNATSYKIYQLTDSDPVLKRTVTSTSTVFTYMLEGENIYEVRASSDRFGESQEGSQVSFKVVYPEVKAPEGLAYKVQNGNDIVLSWSAVEHANSYKVYEVVDGQKVLKATRTTLNATFTNVAAGEHTYMVESFSTRFGASKESSQVTFNVVYPDMQAPESFTYKVQNGNDIVLNWIAAEYADSYKVYELVNGQKVMKYTGGALNTVLTNVSAGKHTYEVDAVSTRFGESVESRTLSFDLVHPVMQAPGNGSYTITNGNDITLTWNTVLYGNSYKVYQRINNELFLLKTTTVTSFKLTDMPEGDYEYVIHSVSTRFGESPEGTKINFNLTWPTVAPPALTGTISNVNNITLNWKTVPWANEYRVYQITDGERKLVYKGTALKHNVYNLTEDTHSFEVTAYSTRFGESAPSEQVTEKIVYPVMQAPEATLTLTSDTSARIVWDFVTYANGYNIYELVNGKPVLVAEKVNNLSYTVNNLSYANHEYFVTSYSNSFGESDRSNVVLAKLIVDTEAPVTKAEAPAGWTNQKASVALSATDNETGVVGTYYSVDGREYKAGTSFTIEEEGVHNVSFYSVDKVGNKETAQTIEVKIDQTPPVTKAEGPAGWSKENAAVKLAATDEASGVAQTFYSINGSDYTEGATVIVEKEGIHSISYFSVDKARNKEEAKMIEVKVDQTAPVTKADATNTWSKENVTVKLEASDEASGIAQTFYSINGADYTEGTSFTVEKEGVNKVSFYSVDKAGNKEAVQTIEVKIDQTAPVTRADATEAWSKEDVTVKLEASDEASDIAQTFYSINGAEYTEGTSFTVEKEGVNKVSFYSVDKAGNKEAVQTIEVKVDKTAPLTQSDASGQWLKEDVVIHLTATDHASGAAKTYYSIDGSAYKEGTSFTISKEGITTVSFYTTDQAGNAEEANTIEVKIDKTAPVVSMNLSEEYALGASLDLAYKAEDTTSGVSVETLTFNGQTYKNGDDVTLGQPGTYTASVTVTDEAGWTTTVEKTIVVYIPASIDVNPGVIKQNTGVITVQVTVPKEFNPVGFDLSSAQLNGVSANNGTNGLEQQAKKGQFKFNREEFTWKPGTAKAEFRGMLNGYLVVGSKNVEIK